MLGITIFTPSFNRANELVRCYKSIMVQRYKRLEWIIVDDGSTDNTFEIVSGIKSESPIDITYVYQENSGKQAAWNRALELSKFDLFIGLDSDDALYEGALHQLQKFKDILSNDDIVGIRALSVSSESGCPSNNFLLEGDKIASWFEELKSGKHGERIDIFKKNIIKNYKYPVGDRIKFIPEVWLYSQLAKKYRFIYTPTKVRIFFDNVNENRLSRTKIASHAEGHYLARKSLLENTPLNVWVHRPVDFFKTVIRLNQVILFLGYTSSIFNEIPLRILVFPSLLINRVINKNG